MQNAPCGVLFNATSRQVDRPKFTLGHGIVIRIPFDVGLQILRLFFYLLLYHVVAVFTESQTMHRYETSWVDWALAKQQCKCTGNLAILDTEEKQTQLLAGSKCTLAEITAKSFPHPPISEFGTIKLCLFLQEYPCWQMCLDRSIILELWTRVQMDWTAT